MAGLAVLLKAQGHDVSGCDVSASPRTKWLETQGVPVAIGHDPAHVAGVDELIVTPAVDRANPEILAASVMRVRSRGAVLAELVGARDAVAVCGSHGKTTTATWTARLLRALGEDAAWCIGGETGDFPVAGTGTGPLVVEADESDGTLALYRAKTLVVNACEYDHPDHFPTRADYFACFDAARANAGDVIESGELGSLGAAFDACVRELPEHNRRNARAAAEVALRRGHRLDDILRVLPDVVSELPDRRFQVVWPVDRTLDAGRSTLTDGPSVTVVTDYAHHPTEMKCAVAMARSICRGRLRVLFQPHRYSRTRALLEDFPSAFEGADETVLCPTYAAFERPVEGGDIADLYAACRRFPSATGAFYLARSCDEAWEHARNSMAEGDVTLLLGAGDIIRLVPRVRADLAAGRRAAAPVRKIWIGAGSNTWKSDLNLSVEYVRTTGPAGRPGASLGIPWMTGIPGTIGGWVKMNAGAFGHSIGEAVLRVKADGEWLDAAACGFGYRRSEIRGEIQDVVFKPEALHGAAAAAAGYAARRRRFPAHTWGSFFKNPPGDFAGRLLEAVGAKDLRVGGARVWGEHANVIVADEGSTPSDVLALARLMRERVRHRLGVVLEPEVCGIEFGS